MRVLVAPATESTDATVAHALIAVDQKMLCLTRYVSTGTELPCHHFCPRPRLCIAVLGVGKIGSAFAFQLARAGHHDVIVVARPGSSRLRQLQHDHGIVDIKGERANVRVADTLDEETPYDLAIVTLVDYQVDAVLPALQ